MKGYCLYINTPYLFENPVAGLKYQQSDEFVVEPLTLWYIHSNIHLWYFNIFKPNQLIDSHNEKWHINHKLI